MRARQDTCRFQLGGQFLVASPQTGPPYHRCVVLLSSHGEDGARGILLDNELFRSLERLGEHLDRLVRPTNRRASVPVDLKLRLVHWEAGQLDQEYAQGVWMTTPATIDRLSYGRGNGDLWVNLVRHIGRSVLRDALNIQDFPTNPAVN